MTAEGDILYASGANTLAKLAKGSDDESLILASGVPSWSSVGGGLTEADSWRVNTTFQGTAAPIAANWERSDSAGQGKLGTGMTESSGVFSFPSTGWWFVIFGLTTYGGSGIDKSVDTSIRSTTDDSTWIAACAQGHSTFAAGRGSSTKNILFDVDDVSLCKIRVNVNCAESSTNINGDTNTDYTSIEFLRLADT